MMKQPLIELFKYVHAELHGCEAPLIWQNVRTVIRNFCKRTAAWQFDLDRILTKNGVTDYDLDGWPVYAQFERIAAVMRNGRLQEPGKHYDLVMEGDAPILRMNLSPCDNELLEVKVVLIPSLTAELIDAGVYQRWFLIWKYGILFELQNMKGMSWSDPAQAPVNYRRYENGVAEAIIYVRRGGVGKNLVARPRWGFA